jgi:hypothetical protein
MRWRFADPNNEAEMAYRGATIKNIEQFWYSFERDLKILESDDIARCVEWVTAELPKVSPDLMWELSPEIAGERRFVITAENKYFMHPMVSTMLEHAPTIPGFQFMMYPDSPEPDMSPDW